MGILLTNLNQLKAAGKDSRLLVVFTENYRPAKTGIYLLDEISIGDQMAMITPTESGLTEINPFIIQLGNYFAGRHPFISQITLLSDSCDYPDFVLGCRTQDAPDDSY